MCRRLFFLDRDQHLNTCQSLSWKGRVENAFEQIPSRTSNFNFCAPSYHITKWPRCDYNHQLEEKNKGLTFKQRRCIRWTSHWKSDCRMPYRLRELLNAKRCSHSWYSSCIWRRNLDTEITLMALTPTVLLDRAGATNTSNCPSRVLNSSRGFCFYLRDTK